MKDPKDCDETFLLAGVFIVCFAIGFFGWAIVSKVWL